MDTTLVLDYVLCKLLSPRLKYVNIYTFFRLLHSDIFPLFPQGKTMDLANNTTRGKRQTINLGQRPTRIEDVPFR